MRSKPVDAGEFLSSYVRVGAAGPGLLSAAGKYVLAWYLGRESRSSPYGAAGAVIVILLWVYYASVILFLGAEFTRAYAKELGPKLAPSEFAVPVTAEARAEEGMATKDNGVARQPAARPRRIPSPAK